MKKRLICLIGAGTLLLKLISVVTPGQIEKTLGQIERSDLIFKGMVCTQETGNPRDCFAKNNFGQLFDQDEATILYLANTDSHLANKIAAVSSVLVNQELTHFQ